MPDIHPSAIVYPQAELADNVEVGPYAVVQAHAKIGSGCRIGAYSMVHSGTVMGENNSLSEHVVLGGPPQDIGFDPDCPSGVEIGANNRFREFFTVHRSTREGGVTRIGSDGFFMFSSHVAHDCVVEDQVVLAGYTALAGHVRVGHRAFLSGHVLVHQHARIGRLSMIAGLTAVERDVLPYFLLGRNPTVHYGLNRVGLKRAGVEGERYRELEMAWRALRGGCDAQEIEGDGEEVGYLRTWLSEPSERGHCPLLRPGMRREKG